MEGVHTRVGPHPVTGKPNVVYVPECRIEDPEGELKPRTPGQADATGDALGAGAVARAALAAGGWMAWR
ncbi:hypothetical protein CLM82_20220, partial [Streptomyces albidoflavus]